MGNQSAGVAMVALIGMRNHPGSGADNDTEQGEV